MEMSEKVEKQQNEKTLNYIENCNYWINSWFLTVV